MKTRFLGRLDRLFGVLGGNRILFIALVLIALLGWLDYVTGFEISFSFFYLLPISLTAWYVGIGTSHLITGISVLTWLISNRLAGEVYSSEWIHFFNAGVRLVVFTGIATLLYELKTAFQLERRIARTDYLTGVFNRREFIEQLGLELRRADRLKYPISLAYIDLDNFKQVNDEQGHSAGDEHLKLIATTISNVIRKTDLFARLGGDEFGLFLANVDRRNAEFVLKKIQSAVMHELEEKNSPVTLSIGVVTFLSPPLNVDAMLRRADELMYQAKNKGKDRAVYFTEE